MALLVLTVALLPSCDGSQAAPPPNQRPAADLDPEAVVRLQLQALQDNDTPAPDAGIARVWAFAHPANRAATGPLPRFTAMLRSPAYNVLIDHRSHSVKPARSTPDRAAFEVLVTGRNGARVRFGWVLDRFVGPRCAGCWLTTGVAPGPVEPPAI